MLLIIVSVFTICFTSNVHASATQYLYGQKNSLYGPQDNVLILNSTNFKQTVFGTENAWLIEFYSNWCGHCIKLAPVYKDLATDVAAWRTVITVAAVNCAQEENEALCREYEVVAYPTLKFFKPSTRSGELGNKYDKPLTVKRIRKAMIDFLNNMQDSGLGRHWPRLDEYRGSDVRGFLKGASQGLPIVGVIVEDQSSMLGETVILDMSRFDTVYLRRVLDQNARFIRRLPRLSKSPSLVLYEGEGRFVEVSPQPVNRKGFTGFLVDRLKELGKYVEPEPTNPSPTQKPTQIHKVPQDVVYSVDIENAVLYSLHHEVALHKEISGSKMHALKNYISVLVKYFPGKPDLMQFLKDLQTFVNSKTYKMKGSEFVEHMNNLTNISGLQFQLKKWVGCSASRPALRGYPCSLWMLFHTLTVNSVKKFGNDSNFNPLEVLNAVAKYVENFFACQECSVNFMNMVRKSLSSVNSSDDSILWLWNAHNLVNERLSGDDSEDPLYPKVQFPKETSCPKCYNDAKSFERHEVLLFLKYMYDPNQLSAELSVSGSAVALPSFLLNLSATGYMFHRLFA